MQNFQTTIEALYQVLRAESREDMLMRLRGQGVFLTMLQLDNAIQYLRRRKHQYGFTIAYSGDPGPHKYITLDLDKDGEFHTDPGFKAALSSGSKKASKTINSYATHVGVSLRAAACATHIPRSLREDFAWYADEYDRIAKNIKRLYRKLDEFEANGTNGG